jgi:hypothetical protein
MKQNKMTIPTALYVGVNSSKGSLPHAKSVPHGEDRNSLIWKSDLDKEFSSSRLGGIRKDAYVTTIDNVPLSGFKIVNRHGKDYIEDPRGFMMDVSNLEEVMATCLVVNSEILDECLWGKIISNTKGMYLNMLICTNSPMYDAAIENTDVAGKAVSTRNVKIGNKVLLRNNTVGVYLGKVYKLTYDSYHYYKLSEEPIKQSNGKYSVFYVDRGEGSYTNQIHLESTLNIASVVEDTVMSDDDAELFINELLHNSQCQKLGSWSDVIVVTYKPIKFDTDFAIELEPYHVSKPSDIQSKYDVYVDVAANNTFGKINYSDTISMYDKVALSANKLAPVTETSTGYLKKVIQRRVPYKFDANDSFYKLKVRVNTAIGNIIEGYLD